MAKKYSRSQYKKERNAQKDTRPSATLSNARVSVTKACFVLDAIRGKSVQEALGILLYNPRYVKIRIVNRKIIKVCNCQCENNNGMNQKNLYVAECYANKRPTMKKLNLRHREGHTESNTV